MIGGWVGVDGRGQCHSYRACLEVAAEAGLRSVAVGAIHLASKGYPTLDAAHVALRTIRRFLERHVDTFEVVVISVTGDDFAAFSQVRVCCGYWHTLVELEECDRESKRERVCVCVCACVCIVTSCTDGSSPCPSRHTHTHSTHDMFTVHGAVLSAGRGGGGGGAQAAAGAHGQRARRGGAAGARHPHLRCARCRPLTLALSPLSLTLCSFFPTMHSLSVRPRMHPCLLCVQWRPTVAQWSRFKRGVSLVACPLSTLSGRVGVR
jgi:hypothetical protein